MKRFIFAFVCFMSMVCSYAQTDSIFNTYIYNQDYKIYIDMNFYENNINVPGQAVFGAVPGYLGAVRDSRKWLVSSVKMQDKNTAVLEIINDYGSEDFTATLIFDPKKGTYTFRQNSGSRLKIVVDRKWQKIPTEVVFVPHERVPDEW